MLASSHGEVDEMRHTITLMGLLLACDVGELPADNAGTTTNPGGNESGVPEPDDPPESSTTGEPEAVCGDGVVDPGEDCDDGNHLDDDGCTASCLLGPCEWAWVRRDPALTSDSQPWAVVSPMVLDEERAWIAHQSDPPGERGTRLLHAGVDGSTLATHDFDLTPGDDTIYALALDPGGDVFLGHSRFNPLGAEIRRMQPDGTQLWLRSHEMLEHVAGLELAANGDLIVVATAAVGLYDKDVVMVALDPADGSERWVQTYSGPIAPGGYSIDHGAGLAIDEQGRRFVGIDESVDWDTVNPAVAAYAPGDSGEPLWVTRVVDMPGQQLTMYAIAVGPDGTVAVGFISPEETQPFTIAALDGATGAVQWVVERDDLEGSFMWSEIRGIALREDRLMATGSWYTEVGGELRLQGYALGLNLDGSLACLTTLDSEDLESPGIAVMPTAIEAAQQGFRVAGFTLQGTQIDLLQAMIR
jgi:cysteine-rich repeat protein